MREGRLASSSALFWRELKQQRLPGVGTVVAMSSVAGFLASFFIHLRGADSAELKITSELLQQIDVI